MSAPPEAQLRPGLRVLARISTVWDWVERTLVGLLGAAAMVIAAVQVFGRYIAPGEAITWAEEVIVYLAVWAVMIVASQLVRTDSMVRPDLVLRLMPPGTQRWVEMFNCVVALVFSAGLVWYGWTIVDTALLIDERSSTDLQFPMWIYYLSLPVGGGLMLLRYAMRLVRFALFYDPATMSVGHMIPPDEVPAGIETSAVD